MHSPPRNFHPPSQERMVFDGKPPPTGGQQILTAVTVPSLRCPGSGMVADQRNEIPAARARRTRFTITARQPKLPFPS